MIFTDTFHYPARAGDIYGTLRKLSAVLALLLLLVLNAETAPLYTGVAVSDVGTGNNIGDAITSRNIAVAPNGDIFVVFRGSTGIRIAQSTNSGQSFNSSVLISAATSEPDIEIASNGYIYIAWIASGSIWMSRSIDEGLTFTSPATVGASTSNAVHLSSYSSKVYALDRLGGVLYRNNNYGLGAFASTFIASNGTFSDVKANPTNGDVYVMSDNPAIRIFKSTDNGQNFTQININPAISVGFSSYAVTWGLSDNYIFVAGGNSNPTLAYKINADNGSYQQLTVAAITNQLGRTLATNPYGNLIDGYFASGSLYYRVSSDMGQNWETAVTVAAGSSHNLAVNQHTQDILVAYTYDGQVYMSVFRGELITPMTVTTGEITFVGCNTVEVTGTVNSRIPVISMGICWGTNAQPTINDSYSAVRSASNTFSVVIAELCAGTGYYVRAYAINSGGELVYGEPVYFDTQTWQVTLELSPNVLWPPNRTLRTIGASFVTNIECADLTYSLTSIVSSEPDQTKEKNDNANDIQNAEFATDDRSFKLRAERIGRGTGRVYTVTYDVNDNCGNEIAVSGTVTVPHDMRKDGVIDFFTDDKHIDIYPNPASDFINLNLLFVYSADLEISVLDLMGTQVRKLKSDNTQFYNGQIDISELPAGIYIIKILFGEELYMEKLIKR
jgi:hypothetical protein